MTLSSIERIIHEWADGRHPEGVTEYGLASALRTASWGYGAVMHLRNLAYASGLKKSATVAPPVISIGNLSAGGTGKTPFVLLTARLLQDAGRKVAVVSRGFRREDASKPTLVSKGEGPLVPVEESGDEPRMLASQMPGLCVAVGSSRYDAAKLAVDACDADTLILDDGFQHRGLHRDVDIVLWDALRPIEHQALLPRGILREGLASLRRADALVITRQNMTKQPVGALIETFHAFAPNLRIFVADAMAGSIIPVKVGGSAIRLGGNTLPDTASRVGAICGIGNPLSFWALLDTLDYQVVYRGAFPDHYRPAPAELDEMIGSARRDGAQSILTTEKDVQNLPQDWHSGLPLYCVRLETQIRGGVEAYRDFILSVRKT